MVPCQALRLLIYVVLWNKRRRDRENGVLEASVSTEKESVSSHVRLPATRVYTFNIRTCVYVRIIMYVH